MTGIRNRLGVRTPRMPEVEAIVAELPGECDIEKAVGFCSHVLSQPPHLSFVHTSMHHTEWCWQSATNLPCIVGTADDGRQHLAGNTSDVPTSILIRHAGKICISLRQGMYMHSVDLCAECMFGGVDDGGVFGPDARTTRSFLVMQLQTTHSRTAVA